MVNKKPLNPGESPAAFCGAHMRAKREEAGLSLEQLGTRVFTGAGYLAQIERAERKLQPDLAQLLDREFGTDSFFKDLATAIKKASRLAEYFADTAELEQIATAILEYAPTLIPGLLQTEAYARALMEAADPLRPPEKVEEMVAARLERSRRFFEKDQPRFWVVLHETLIRAGTGGPAAAHAQLLHLATAVREKKVVIQIFPLASAMPPPLNHMITFLTFEDAPPMVYIENEFSGRLIDDPEVHARYRRSYDWLRAAALSPEASLTLIESLIKEYEDR
ncbi:helix-turn-helix domain-containing protein [Streptomyces johnsoniae]|uniref:Helix-turn-helix transcriptional regulator n=1 Tax=Streptomyces johnsoniae TaxID=3075532 RepID=A0ABU2S0I3_9ACTN|nr:helix-turn-helix transcriptional regulator [Streptomyces sp. DSM 41886]MDT0441949.1 helix-turn-helix transcriptional regulator [Streptomyces sp. DSM 41886]